MSKIPSEYRTEFLNDVCRVNFKRMTIIAVLLVTVEPMIAVFLQTPGSVDFYISLGIALFSLIFLPVLHYLGEQTERVSLRLHMAVQILFLTGILTAGIILSLQEQSTLGSSSSYFLAVFTVAVFIYMPSKISLCLFFLFNIIFLLLLPLYQTVPVVLLTLNINTLSTTLVAWILNQMVFREKVKSFLNEKLILEKNIELEKKNTELNELTMRDSMTNLLNHKSSIRRLKEEVDRAKRIQYPLSVAMIDLDNFKLVNDGFGHQTGDQVLIQVAAILSESCRTTDTVGRYGGEEFIIIMPDTNSRDAALLLERIHSRIRETSFAEGIHITASCGISQLNEESVLGILKSSDVMLYEAKKKGKNRVEVQSKREKKSAVIN